MLPIDWILLFWGAWITFDYAYGDSENVVSY